MEELIILKGMREILRKTVSWI